VDAAQFGALGAGAVVLVGALVAIVATRKVTQVRVFWLARDAEAIILMFAAALMLGLFALVAVPGGIWVALLVLFGLAAWLNTQVVHGTLNLNEYAFVLAGTSLVATWHHPDGARYFALKATKIVKTTLGFQAVAFKPDDPVTAVSIDGIELKVDLTLAYFIRPVVPDIVLQEGQVEPTAEQLADYEQERLFKLWRLGDASKIVDQMAKPQLAQATRHVLGQFGAMAAVSSGREVVRAQILEHLVVTLPPQGLLPVGLTLGGVVADAAVRDAWVEQARIVIDPALSPHKLEEMRIAAVAQANTVIVPGNTPLFVALPGQTPAADQSP
jgi:hypothetical protein